jgi:hypothetical protein
MSRAWFALAVVAVVGVFCLAFGQDQPPPRRQRATQQDPAQPETRPARGAPRGQVGRYQMAVRDGAQPSARPYVVVCDTATGRCWVASLTPGGGQGWRALGGPSEVPVINPAAIEAPRLDPPTDAAPRLPPADIEPPRAGDIPVKRLEFAPPAVRPADAIPALPLPALPNDLPRAVPGELPPRLPGEQPAPPAATPRR